MFSNNTLVCINPNKTLSVFLSMYRSDTTRSRTLFSLHEKEYVSKRNKAKVQLAYILDFIVHLNNMDR